MDLKNKLRHVMDFPKKGIDFIDITTILQDGEAFSEVLASMREKALSFGDFDLIAATESRGFIFGAPLAGLLEKGFIPVRKKGKLPFKTISQSYDLEYGKDYLEMHTDAVKPGMSVLIADDLLATGGTAQAVAKMVEKLGGAVAGYLFFIELSSLNGREKLRGKKVESVISF